MVFFKALKIGVKEFVSAYKWLKICLLLVKNSHLRKDCSRSEELTEYNFVVPCEIFLLLGNKRSGGLASTTASLLENSVLARPLDETFELAS
jgi:hypothetical protein